MAQTRIKLGSEEIGFITLFENTTGASVKDCIFNENKKKILLLLMKAMLVWQLEKME